MKNTSKKQITLESGRTYNIPNGNLGFIPKSKKEKKLLLTKILRKALAERWRTCSKDFAAFERKIIEELIDNL